MIGCSPSRDGGHTLATASISTTTTAADCCSHLTAALAQTQDARTMLELHDSDRFEDQTITDLSLPNSKAIGLSFVSAKLIKLIARAASWRNARFCDVSLDASDFANADFLGAKLLRTKIANCKLTGINLGESSLTEVHFVDCRLDQSWFQKSKFERCVFERCDLTAADFESADLSGGVSFKHCKLREAQFRSARLRGADFRTSEIGGLQANAADLRGVIIEPSQAADLAPLLGVVMRSRSES